MKIFPAIDIKDKKCVRLIKGDFENKTEYDMSPVEQARKYKDNGFKNLHIVDLDGALTGEPINIDIIQDIVGKLELKIEIGGGVRNFETYIINIDYNIETAVGEFGYRFRGYNQQKFESAPTADPDDLRDFTGDVSEPELIYDR